MTGEKNPTIKNLSNISVSSTVMAKLLGLTTARIRQLENEKVLTKISRGKYLLQDNISQYIKYLKINSEFKNSKNETSNINSDDSSVDYDKERALLEKAKREKAELQLKAMRGEYHDSKSVEKVMNDMIANFKSKLLSLPSRASPQILGLDNIGEIQEVLQREIQEALTELSEYDPKKFNDDKKLVGAKDKDD